jgi:hypothetical protein
MQMEMESDWIGFEMIQMLLLEILRWFMVAVKALMICRS